MIHISPEQAKAMIDLYLIPGNNIATVRAAFKLHERVVKRVFKQNGVPSKPAQEIYGRLLSDQEIEKIKIMYVDRQEPQRVVAKEMGMCAKSIRGVLKNLGIPLRKCTARYTDNDRFFEKIDSHEKAHVLGFLYADGYIGVDRGRLCLKLAVKDIDYLTHVRDLIAPERPIRRRWCEGPFGIHEFAEMEISNAIMVQDLVRFGLHQKKSLTLEWPINLPDEFIPSFILGYFDGDGCITEGDRNCRIISMLGTPIFLEKIATLFNERFKTTVKVKPASEGRKISQIQCGGNWQIMNILDWLYSGKATCLARKREKYENLKREYANKTRPNAAKARWNR